MDWKDSLSKLLPDDYVAPVESETEVPEAERQKGKLTVTVERKGRSGKTATIISGFTISDEAVAQVAARLKKHLGTGGSARGGEILIQGDCRDRVVEALKAIPELNGSKILK